MILSGQQWPLGVLLFGLVLLVLAMVSTFTGRTYVRGITDRAKEPFDYWTMLLVQYLGGGLLIWYYFYKLAQ